MCGWNIFLDYYVHGRKNFTTINSPLSSWWGPVILPASQCSILPSSRHRTARRFGSGSSWPPGSPECWTKSFLQPLLFYWPLNVLYLAFTRLLSPEYHLLQHGRGSQGCAFLQRTQSRWIFQICKMNVFLKILFVLSILTLGWKLNFLFIYQKKISPWIWRSKSGCHQREKEDWLHFNLCLCWNFVKLA